MRGGLGLVREWRFIAEHGLLNASFDAFASRPYGLAGGEPGRGGRLSVIRDGEVTALPAKTIGCALQAGDIVRMETPGGGGYGDPASAIRPPCRRRLADGYCRPSSGGWR